MANSLEGSVKADQIGPSKWVLVLAGEHDLSTAPAIAEAFERIGRTGTIVVVDLSEASFIDSTVIAALIARVRLRETLLLVAPADGPIRRGLEVLLGGSSVMDIFETRDQALQAAKKSGEG